MKPNTEKSVQTYVKLVRTAEALHNLVGRGLMVEGLTSSQFSTLKVLRIHGALAQRDIAKHILKTGGNITMVVDNLEREGLVVRDRDTVDRRVVHVRLTQEGEDLFDRIYPAHLQRIRDVMGPLSDEEIESLMSILDKLACTESDASCPVPDATSLSYQVR